jgi:ABC-type branched-subunit amino acid transport system substrate-binding protein
MYYTSVAAPVSQFPNAAQFATDYEAAYGESAPPFSAQAYDAMSICLGGVIRAAVDAGAKPTREQVVAAVSSSPNVQGITGTYIFNEKGDIETATYFVLQANVADWNANELITRLDIAPPQ